MWWADRGAEKHGGAPMNERCINLWTQPVESVASNRRSHFFHILAAILVSFFSVSCWSAPITIDTTGGNGSFNGAAPFGDGDAGEAYGQTFLVPLDHSNLTAFSFWVYNIPDTSNQPLKFSAVVMAWDTDRASGPVLYESPIQTLAEAQIPFNPSAFTEFSFSTNGVLLTPGQKYVAFLSATNEFWDTNTTTAQVGYMGPNDFYLDGKAWFLNTFGIIGVETLLPWSNSFGSTDLAFQATFSPVPIPAAVYLFGSALLGLGWMRRKA
jgi:hypothetical protein